MSHGKSTEEYVQHTHNTARFFTETRQVAWVLLLATMIWGVYSYLNMPERKDPDIPVRVALAICPWPGAAAEKVEDLVTRKLEKKIAENSKVTKIESITRSSVCVITMELDENITERAKEFDDIKGKLDSITDLPQGAGPIQFFKDYGDTAALMLTVASPKVDEVEIAVRSQAIARAIREARAPAAAKAGRGRTTIVLCFPQSYGPRIVDRSMLEFERQLRESKFAADLRPIKGPGFAGFDFECAYGESDLRAIIQERIKARLTDFHPDIWEPLLVRDPEETRTKLTAVAGDKYTFRQLDDYTDLIQKTLQTVEPVSKIDRSGILNERVFLEYSQERLGSSGMQQSQIEQILNARNIMLPGGVLETSGKNIMINPSGEFKNEGEIGDVIVGSTPDGSPVYLRNAAEIFRGYESPPSYLNFFTTKDAAGNWQRSRAITLSVQMRAGEQIGKFGEEVDVALGELRKLLPPDLILARTSDQPLQVTESVELFMDSLYEAIILVVLVALIGFWEWRSAALMALSIPLTLAMTFGFMHLLGVDLQQVSIASLILALGLLVDDPVVAGDAIKRELDAGQPGIIAAWLGPTRLAHAILFATITNIVAYLPFLLLPGDMGRFVYSLPMVLACSLVASRLVSMTFIPTLGYYFLRPSRKPPLPMAERRKKGFAGWYYRVGTLALNHSWKTLLVSFAFLGLGVFLMTRLKDEFFPKDLSYLSFVDVWLPEDAPISATDAAAHQAEAVIRRVVDGYGKATPEDGQPRQVLKYLTTFVGGGGPRFWFSVSPEQRQLNYAQIIIQVENKRDTMPLVAPIQAALDEALPGVRADMRQLESGQPIGTPIAMRISGEDLQTLRGLAEQMKDIYRAHPATTRIRDDWGAESFYVELRVDPDRANLARVSNLDVAVSSTSAMSGYPLTTLRDGDKQIPVVARLRANERANFSDIQNLYVYSMTSAQKVPLRQVSSTVVQMETEKVRRRNQFRTVTVSCYPVAGQLASTVVKDIWPKLEAFEQNLPVGYKLEVGGEKEQKDDNFVELLVILAICVAAIFMALVFQFHNAVKPFIVFSAIPYGMVGAFAGLVVMDAPFSFMAFLGCISLIGVIVSHVIVLFDFIEEKHAEGEPMRLALLDAGIIRLRPVLITVGATVFALFPLAMHGGPLWEPLCYAQIGGLTAATFITLILVPVIYSIVVLDLKLVKWEGPTE